MNYKGRELNAPHVIVIRCILWPVLMGLGALMTLLLAIGWGVEDAKLFWEDL